MPDKPRKLPPLGFAGFEASAAAGGRSRRKPMWSLHPLREPGDAATMEARRILDEDQVQAGIGRRPK
jgi:hypothetical protein